MPIAPGQHDGITGVTFSSDGHRLLGTLYLARGSEPKPTALLHGCPGLQQNGDLAVALRDHGWNSLIFHYRGSWGSGGRYDLRTVPADVTAAVDHLSGGAYPAVDPRRLVAVGHSLGGWAALLAAARDPRLRAVAVCAAAVDIGALDVSPAEIEREFTRFLAVTPAEFRRQREEAAARLDPLAAPPPSRPGRCWSCTAQRTRGSRWRRPGSSRGGRASPSAMRRSTVPAMISPGNGPISGIS
jgi:pimeloyl-ACP methyl ester carboxylesterase